MALEVRSVGLARVRRQRASKEQAGATMTRRAAYLTRGDCCTKTQVPEHSLAAMVSKVAIRLIPAGPIRLVATTAISAPIKPYSIAVAPRFFLNLERNFFMIYFGDLV
jgi:hypothetical protein